MTILDYYEIIYFTEWYTELISGSQTAWDFESGCYDLAMALRKLKLRDRKLYKIIRKINEDYEGKEAATNNKIHPSLEE